jgi:hypothetical protein
MGGSANEIKDGGPSLEQKFDPLPSQLVNYAPANTEYVDLRRIVAFDAHKG